MSGVYWIAFPKRFLNPVTVEVQHCALVEHADQLSSLSFVTAKCTQKELPYNFRPLNGGEFSGESCYGTIKMNHFSAVAVVSSGKQRAYVALTYYTPQVAFAWLMDFIIVRNLELYLQVCVLSTFNTQQWRIQKVIMGGALISLAEPCLLTWRHGSTHITAQCAYVYMYVCV